MITPRIFVKAVTPNRLCTGLHQIREHGKLPATLGRDPMESPSDDTEHWQRND